MLGVYVEKMLVPAFQSGHILNMDNLAAHKVELVRHPLTHAAPN